MDEKSKVPLVWLIVALFVGGTSLITMAAAWSRLNVQAAYTDSRVTAVEVKQDKYAQDIQDMKTSLVRIEQKVDDIRNGPDTQ